MKIENSIAFVTGANRGLGLAFARALLAAGAKKVYAAAREPSSITLEGVIPVKLDVTKSADAEAAAALAGDVTLLVNNAGIAQNSGLFAPGTIDAIRAELETNVLGPLALSRAFAPVLAKNGGGAIVDVLSALAWVTMPSVATYSVSKSAAWSLTNGLRNELAKQGTQVVALHVGFMDTDMAKTVTGPKSSPDAVARLTLEAVARGEIEVLADDVSKQVKSALSSAHAPYLIDISNPPAPH